MVPLAIGGFERLVSRRMPSSNNQPSGESWHTAAALCLASDRSLATTSLPLAEPSDPRFGSRRSAQLCPSYTTSREESAARIAQKLPPEVDFLIYYGLAPGVLMAAAEKARAQGVSTDAVLLGERTISEDHFYRALARHLRLPFLEGAVRLGPAADYPQSIKAGLVPLAGSKQPAFLAAPRGKAIAHLIAATHNGSLSARLSLTTPAHMAELVHAAYRQKISHDASFGLSSHDPALCARGGPNAGQCGAASISALVLALSLLVAPAVTGTVCGVLLSTAFIAVIWLRLGACAASLRPSTLRFRHLEDFELPLYSIVVALYREARIVPQLLAALNRLDYPRAKLELKFVIEEDDHETFWALRRAGCPDSEVIVAPSGTPRTKPRALNAALPLLRGQFVAIFDAEDVPDPSQIKMAVQRFAAAPARLGCLQARLAIDNIGDGWLTRGMLAQTPEGRLSEPGGAVRANSATRTRPNLHRSRTMAVCPSAPERQVYPRRGD